MTDEVVWPNQTKVVEGVVPSDEVSQDKNLADESIENDPDLFLEMGE